MVHGVEACRARCDGLEERGEELFRDGEVRHGGVPLEAEKQKPAAEQQNAGGCQNELAVQLQALPAEAAADKIAPDEKAKSTDDDEHADRQAHKRIGHIGRQGRKRRTHAHEVEACIAEGGDGVEHGGVDAAQNAKFRDEPDGKQCGTRKFEHERKRE